MSQLDAISSHVIFNVAVAHVAHKVTAAGHAQPSSSEVSEWFMQGVSIALGRYIHGKVSERRPLYEKLAELREFAAAKHLLRDADALLRHAMTAETKPTDEHALSLLASQRRLIADELAVLDAAVSDPAKRQALKMTEATLRAARRYAHDRIAELNTKELSELPLHRAGLEELVDGEWKGSRAQVQRAIDAARRAGIEVAGKPGSDGVWRELTIGGREIKIHERHHETAEARANVKAAETHDRQPTKPLATPRLTEAQAVRRAVMERYKDLTATDFTGVDDPRLKEIADAAREENAEVQARLRTALETAGVKDVEIQYRAKSLSSLLGKLKETSGTKVQDIKDLSGVRVNITRVSEANFAQYNKIKAVFQQEFGIHDSAVKDYNKKPNPWGYTGRIHMFEIGGAKIFSEIQVGSRDLSAFIEKKFTMLDGKVIELHDLTGYKGQLYGKAVPPELQAGTLS